MILLIYSARRRKHIRPVLVRAHHEEEHHPIHVKHNRVKPLERIMHHRNLLEKVAISKLHGAVRHQRGRLVHKDIREARHFLYFTHFEKRPCSQIKFIYMKYIAPAMITFPTTVNHTRLIPLQTCDQTIVMIHRSTTLEVNLVLNLYYFVT